MKNEQKRPSGCITLRIAAVLLCLVLFSMHLTAGLYARYTAKQGGSDSARVSAFHVDVEGVGNSVTVDYKKGDGKDSGTQTLIIHNNSEVAVAYDITVAFTDLNYGVKVTINGVPQTATGTTSLKFEDVGQIPANTDQVCDLVFAVANWSEFTEKATGKSVSDTLSCTITIDVVQID